MTPLGDRRWTTKHQAKVQSASSEHACTLLQNNEQNAELLVMTQPAAALRQETGEVDSSHVHSLNRRANIIAH